LVVDAAGAAASGAEACANAAVANRPAIRAAISFFMTSLEISNLVKISRLLRPVIAINETPDTSVDTNFK